MSNYLAADDNKIPGRIGVLEWAEEEGFPEFWRMQPEFGEEPLPRPVNDAYAIFMNQPRRKVLQLLLLVCKSHREVSDAYNEKFGHPLEPALIDAYVRLFWDANGMERGAWSGFMKCLVDEEERSLIARGVGQISPDKAKGLVGIKSSLSEGEIVEKIIDTAYRRFETAAEYDPDGGSTIKWADLLLRTVKTSREGAKIAAAAANSGPLEAGDFKSMFSVTIEKTGHPTLADLQGGTSIPVKEDKK